MSELLSRYPCLEFNLSVLSNEEEKVNFLYSFFMSRKTSVSDIEVMAALYAQMGLLSRRYCAADFTAMCPECQDLLCDAINKEDGSMCFTCKESKDYRNRWYDEESSLVSACFAFDKLRETIKKKYKAKSGLIFRSYVRADLSTESSLYVPVNRFIFEEYDSIFLEWIKGIGMDESVIEDLAQRASTGINSKIKEVYPKWRKPNEEFLKNYIFRLIKCAGLIKKPLEYYLQLAEKIYEDVRPVTQKKTISSSKKPQKSEGGAQLGKVGVLFTDKALIDDYNAEQQKRAKMVVDKSKETAPEVTDNNSVVPVMSSENHEEKTVLRKKTVPCLSTPTEQEGASSEVDVVCDVSKDTLPVDVYDTESDHTVDKDKDLSAENDAALGEVIPFPTVAQNDDVKQKERILNDILMNAPVPARLSLGTVSDAQNNDGSDGISFTECCMKYDVIYIDTAQKMESLDAAILGNDIVSCEIVWDNVKEYLLMYLPKQRVFTLLPTGLPVRNSSIVAMYFSLKNMIKLTCYPLALCNWLSRISLPCEGVYDLRTFCGIACPEQMKGLGKDELLHYRAFVATVCGVPSDGKKPDVIYGMPKYRATYLEVKKQMNHEMCLPLIQREMAFVSLLGKSFNLLGIVENCRVPYLNYSVTANGIDKVYLDYNEQITFLDHGCLVTGKYLSSETESGGIMRAYREVCIKLVLSKFASRYDLFLIDMNRENGLCFYVGLKDSASFFTIFNRNLIKCGKNYVTKNPVVDIRIRDV